MYNGVSEEVLDNENAYKMGYLQGVQDSQNKKEVTKDILKMKKEQDEFQREVLDKYGGLYFKFYNRIDIEGQFLFRFLYLCSYMNYDNYLSDGRRLIKYNSLNELLKLSDAEYKRTIKYLIDNKLIKKENNLILINCKYCKKGEIHKTKSIEVIRMFDEAIRELYDKALPREHKKLSLLVAILPYVNFRYNIVCKNPNEDNIELIEPYKMSELCELLGYDKTNSSRLKRQLFALRINKEEVIGIFEKSFGKAILVNPRLYYKGNKLEDIVYLAELFRIK